jgi:phage protein D
MRGTRASVVSVRDVRVLRLARRLKAQRGAEDAPKRGEEALRVLRLFAERAEAGLMDQVAICAATNGVFQIAWTEGSTASHCAIVAGLANLSAILIEGERENIEPFKPEI